MGYRVNSSDKNSGAFADTSTALKTLFGRLDDWIQLNDTKPAVTNPFLSSEDFAASWTDGQYSNFREMANKYRAWIDDAFSEVDRNESIAKWRRVFGEDFAKEVVSESAKSVSRVAVVALKESITAAATFAGDLMDAVKRFGRQALPRGFNKLAHMQSAKWRKLSSPAFSIYIRARLYQSKGYNPLKDNILSLEPLPAGWWLEFVAVTSQGLAPSPNDFRVEWRVTNTDLAAANASCLRGGFYGSEGGQSRFEELRYRGIHLVEAFVIRKRDEIQVAQSEPFQVVIE
jgi:Adenylyl/Guanylyl and SMODS C-terminal sensor domain